MITAVRWRIDGANGGHHSVQCNLKHGIGTNTLLLPSRGLL